MDFSRTSAGLAALGASAMALIAVGGCAPESRLNPLSSGRIDPTSAAAADVANAEHARRGPYPDLVSVPPAPTDVRPAAAWRSAVVSEWGDKRTADAEAAALVFSLDVGAAVPWADAQVAKIPQAERPGPLPDATPGVEAFVQSSQSRATPPPAPR